MQVSQKFPNKSRTWFISAGNFSVTISQQLIKAQTMLTGTQKSKDVMCMPVENKTKALITATRLFIRNHGSFNYTFF